jgi:transcriptional regulator with GAF, ATPase, and Fis domain
MTETLNIDYHFRQLTLKALNKAGSSKLAAPLLGVSERTLHRMKQRYGIQRDYVTRTYYLIEEL